MEQPEPPEPPEPDAPPAPPVEPPYVPKGAPEEVRLPGPVTDVCGGGGGRFLIFQLAGGRKLAVFDTSLAKVVKELPLAEGTTHVAAGRNRLVAVYPGAKVAQFWDLTTFEKEKVVLLPDELTKSPIHQVCMGSACDETLFAYIAPEKRTLAVALGTMKATEVRWNHWGPGGAYGPLEMRVSGDGSVLTGRGGGWAGCDVALFARGKQIGACDKIPFWNAVSAAALPTADGRYVFASGRVLDRALAQTEWTGGKDAYVVPGVEPGFVLALAGVGRVGVGNQPGQRPAAVGVYTEDRQKLFVLREADELTADALPWEKRVFYYPRSGLLLTLAPGKDRLVLRRVDLGEELERTGADYLAVTSRPPPATAGKPFEYQIEVRSKQGGVKYKLEVGPPGMSVGDNGKVVWNEAAGPGRSVNVVIVVSDASGQDVTHSFVLGAEGGFAR
ncbi:hypothetical protein [Frigoriglobus tundricola]|uniref:Uncharacterized protein n=1 Tax=Frigoriglobus tundricola TaxID=2774151 RepID=A0A6M5YLA4_9BACT|nr:hypothetical protein [Frigoriglobus tundricola]QJW93782.1 hypothetical protein FTUN_1293 [Frigoriglobus tundricola]